MSAPDLQSIFQIENAVEPGVSRILQSAGFAVFDQQGKRLATTPRIEVELQLGASTGAMKPYKGGGVFRAWDSVLIFRIVTNRADDAGQHAILRANVRALVQPFAQKLENRALLPWHAVAVIKESGTVPRIEDARGNDISEIHFDAKISVREDAWPA